MSSEFLNVRNTDKWAKRFWREKKSFVPRKNDGKPKKVEKERKKLVPTAHSNSQLVVAAAALPLPFNTSAPKIKLKETNYVKKEKSRKKIFYLNLPSKMLPELMKKIRTKCIGLYYVPAIIFVIVIRLAYEGHSFDSCIPFWLCSVYLEWILLHICTLGTGIQPRICTSELRTITHIPRHPNDLLLSFVFHSVFSSSCEYSFFFLHWKNTKKRKKSVDFPRLRYTNLTKKNAHT